MGMYSRGFTKRIRIKIMVFDWDLLPWWSNEEGREFACGWLCFRLIINTLWYNEDE